MADQTPDKEQPSKDDWDLTFNRCALPTTKEWAGVLKRAIPEGPNIDELFAPSTRTKKPNYNIYESFGQYFIALGSEPTIFGPFETKHSAFKYLDRKGILDD